MTGFTADPSRRAGALRAAVLLAGVVASQAFLYGPSLLGERIALPLDLLGRGTVYLPQDEATPPVTSNRALFDLVLHYEPARRFAAAEVRSGRLPLWEPHYFAGAPFARWEKYSPFSLLSYLFPSPVTLAWLQLAKALLAAAGAYLFFARSLGVGFWPATLGAWAYPNTAYLVFWAGYPISFVVAWLPWMLLATDAAVRRPRGRAGPALALLTAVVILCGHADVAAQVLLTSGFYAIWCLLDVHDRPWRARAALRPVATLSAAWLLGIAASSIYWLPVLEYMQTGGRVEEGISRGEDRPPEGWQALPELVLPDVYGAMQAGSTRLAGGNRLENASAAYVGIVALLFLAPLGWCVSRERSRNRFWGLLAFLSLGWALNVPGLVPLLRLPGVSLLSYNRFVFAASFAILAWAVLGLDRLWRGIPRNRGWFAAPILVLTLLLYGCVRFALSPPGPGLEEQVRAGFSRSFAEGAVFSGLALAAWLVVWMRARAPRGFAPALGVLAVVELLVFARGVNPQADPSLYYPRLPALEALESAPAGRALAVMALPANLLGSHGLRDVRGYDGVDPARLVELLSPLLDERARGLVYPYARLQYFSPRLTLTPEGDLRLPPALDMLNLRYLVFSGESAEVPKPRIVRDGYTVAENPRALPRAWVPRRVERLAGDSEVLARLHAEDFDPREVAFVLDGLSTDLAATGTARVRDEDSGRVELDVELDAPGLVVLADRWDAGWRARVDGQPSPVLRVNHVLRGVQVPAGRSTLVFLYQPAAFSLGWKLSAAATLLALAWSGLASRSILVT